MMNRKTAIICRVADGRKRENPSPGPIMRARYTRYDVPCVYLNMRARDGNKFICFHVVAAEISFRFFTSKNTPRGDVN